MSRMVFLDHPELSGRVSLQRNYKRATLSSAKNTLEIVETIGTAKTGMQEGLNRVLPQEEGELAFSLSRCYRKSNFNLKNKKLVHKVFPQNTTDKSQLNYCNFNSYDVDLRESLSLRQQLTTISGQCFRYFHLPVFPKLTSCCFSIESGKHIFPSRSLTR